MNIRQNAWTPRSRRERLENVVERFQFAHERDPEGDMRFKPPRRLDAPADAP